MPGGTSDREDLRIVGESLELQCVSGWVEEEHRPLLAGLALEADVRFDHELDRRGAEPVGQLVELRDGQDQAEVRHGYVVAVDRVVDALGAGRGQVGDELVAVEVPVHPGVGAAALLETEYLAVETARGGQVVDGHGEVEPRNVWHVSMLTFR